MNSLKQPPNCPQIILGGATGKWFYDNGDVVMYDPRVVGSVAMRAWILERERISDSRPNT